MAVDSCNLSQTEVTEPVNERRTFASEGVEIRRGVLSAETIEAIKAEVRVDHPILRRTGIRNLEKKFGSIARAAVNPSVLSIARSLLGGTPRLVRSLFFDKTPERNWFVAWHQDRTVTLDRRLEIPGWGLWTLKDGVHHVQPPRAVLDQMLTIRLHLDDADEENGCLSVIPESHRLGILAQGEIEREVATATRRACVVCAGDAVVIHPLIVHSSVKSRCTARRRVVHLEYSTYELPAGLSWA
ncbi:MAG: phytanoyl-CoA dioxygenase family protein [Gammaproteobacteria bacterium]